MGRWAGRLQLPREAPAPSTAPAPSAATAPLAPSYMRCRHRCQSDLDKDIDDIGGTTIMRGVGDKKLSLPMGLTTAGACRKS